MTAKKGACHKWKWSKTSHLYVSVATVIFGVNGLVWGTSYIQTANCSIFMICEKIMEKSAFLHEMHNIGTILYFVTVWKVY